MVWIVRYVQSKVLNCLLVALTVFLYSLVVRINVRTYERCIFVSNSCLIGVMFN